MHVLLVSAVRLPQPPSRPAPPRPRRPLRRPRRKPWLRRTPAQYCFNSSNSASVSFGNRLIAHHDGQPNPRRFCVCFPRFASPHPVVPRPALRTLCTVVTSTAAEGFIPDIGITRSRYFSAPRSDAEPALVHHIIRQPHPHVLRDDVLVPCAMLPNGPMCTMRRRVPSVVCTRFGSRHRSSSAIMRP